MPRIAKRFSFQLLPSEVAVLIRPSGKGGHQNLHKEIRSQLAATGNRLALDDAQMGEALRYMLLYGPGGFQGRLKKALMRPLRVMMRI
jgi:hypothetical protein